MTVRPTSSSSTQFAVTGEEPAIAAAIAEAVATHRVRTVPLEVVLAAAAAVDHTAASAVGWRARVATAIGELADAGTVEVPASRFDRSAEPPLPSWLRRPAPARPARAAAPPVVWHGELEWAAAAVDAGTLGAADRRLLTAVNAWLSRRNGQVVPLRERSLEIFGNEKLLETVVFGPLFGPGRLTLDLLECEPCWPPAEQTVLGPGAWLLVENYTTYVTLARLGAETGFDGRVVWGAGNQVGTRLSALAAAGEAPQRLWYFGDVDAGGFKVARSAFIRAAELGFGHLFPAWRLYRLALELGTIQPVKKPSPLRLAPATWVLDWLGGDLGPRCVEIVDGGGRIVQEWVGRRQLTGRRLLELLS